MSFRFLGEPALLPRLTALSTAGTVLWSRPIDDGLTGEVRHEPEVSELVAWHERVEAEATVIDQISLFDGSVIASASFGRGSAVTNGQWLLETDPAGSAHALLFGGVASVSGQARLCLARANPVTMAVQWQSALTQPLQSGSLVRLHTWRSPQGAVERYVAYRTAAGTSIDRHSFTSDEVRDEVAGPVHGLNGPAAFGGGNVTGSPGLHVGWYSLGTSQSPTSQRTIFRTFTPGIDGPGEVCSDDGGKLEATGAVLLGPFTFYRNNQKVGVTSALPSITAKDSGAWRVEAGEGVFARSSPVLQVTAYPHPELPPAPSGPSTGAVGSTAVYSVPAVAGVTHEWLAGGGVQILSQTATSVTVRFTAAGARTVSVRARRGPCHSDFIRTTVQVSGATGYALWASTYFVNVQAADAQPTADPNKDGVPNLLCYAFDLDPHASAPTLTEDGRTTGLPRASLGQFGSLQMHWIRDSALTDLEVAAEFSTDGVNWMPRSSAPVIPQPVPGRELMVTTITANRDGGFVRLRVSLK